MLETAGSTVSDCGMKVEIAKGLFYEAGCNIKNFNFQYRFESMLEDLKFFNELQTVFFNQHLTN